MENEWRKEMCALRDSIFHCENCTAESFFDLELVRQKVPAKPCWGCGKVLPNPPRMRLGTDFDPQLVVLSSGAQLFPHHLERDTYNFANVLAEVGINPLGLRNLSGQTWSAVGPNGSSSTIGKGQFLSLESDCHISFGRVEAQVRVR